MSFIVNHSFVPLLLFIFVFVVLFPIQFVIANESVTALTKLYALIAREVDPKVFEDFMRVFNILKGSGFNPQTAYDIGSNCIQWTNLARLVWPTTSYCLFESIEYFEELYQLFNEKYCLVTLGRATGIEVLYYQNPLYTTGSSYYKEIGSNVSLFTEESAVKKKTKTLTDAVRDCSFPPADIIKFDIQGAELDVVEGSPNDIRRATYLIVEMQHKAYNLGAPNISDVLPAIESLGFLCTHPFIFHARYDQFDGDYGFLRIDDEHYNIRVDSDNSFRPIGAHGSKYLLRIQIEVENEMFQLPDGIVGLDDDCTTIGPLVDHDSTFYVEYQGDVLYVGQHLEFDVEYRFFVLLKSSGNKPIRLYVGLSNRGELMLVKGYNKAAIQTWTMAAIDTITESTVIPLMAAKDGIQIISRVRLLVGPISDASYTHVIPSYNLSFSHSSECQSKFLTMEKRFQMLRG